MDILLTLVMMVLCVVLAFQAGMMKAVIDTDKVDGVKTEKKFYFLMVADLLVSAYLVIAIYGAGLRHG